jgi:hypothetical protein
MDKWKVITNVSEIVNGGIFQEKMAVVCDNPIDYSKLKQLVLQHPNGEIAELPDRYKNVPFAFAYWFNKTDPHISEKDIQDGCLRMKIS